MEQSTLHVAIIMDGNGRWAARQSLPRMAGHHAGTAALRRVLEAGPDLNIGTITVYAFSSDNWKRPADEVSSLFHLLACHLENETRRCFESGVRLQIIGRRDRLPDVLRQAIEHAENTTRNCDRLHLRIAVDYSARDSILRAAQCAGMLADARAGFESALCSPPVDLLIRTGGEQRLSDFLLWECAYAELFFTKRMWPDFDAEDLRRALYDFRRRERRFGGAPPAIRPVLPERERWLR